MSKPRFGVTGIIGKERIALVFLLLLSSASINAEEPPLNHLCTADVPIEQPVGAPVSLGNFHFFAGDASYGAVDITNKSTKEIKFYLIILEMLDRDGKYLLSVPVFNRDEKDGVPFEVSFKSWLQSIEAPSEKPGRTTWTWPIYSQLTLLICPAAARVSMLWLRYADESEFKHTLPELNIPPVLLEGDLAARDFDAWGGQIISGVFTIEPSGPVHLEYIDSGTLALQRLLEEEVSHWRFSGGLTNGRPAAQRLAFILTIGDNLAVQLELMKQKGMSGPILLLNTRISYQID